MTEEGTHAYRRAYDVVSVGSTMLRLSTDHGETLRNATSLTVDIAGAESNTLIALTRLGLRTCWATKISDNPVGRRIVSEVGREGVDVSHVRWTDRGERAELLFVEPGTRPRPTLAHYDRRGASIESLCVDDLTLGPLLDARMYHCTGILPALSPKCQKAALDLKQEAQRRGLMLSLDINHRSKLWSLDEAAPLLLELAQGATLLFLTADETSIFGQGGSALEAAIGTWRQTGAGAVVVKEGAAGAVAYDGQEIHTQPGLDTEVVDRLGAGDAFCAGVIYGYLEGSLQLGLKLGCRMASLKLTTKGDRFLFRLADLQDRQYGTGRDVDR